MRVKVMPAKRVGQTKTIFDLPVGEENIHRGTEEEVVISVLADGIYRDSSRYRYTFEFFASEIRTILANS